MNSFRSEHFHKQHKFIDGPIGEYARQFGRDLQGQHYRKTTIYEYSVCADALGQASDSRSRLITQQQSSAATVESWVQIQRPLPSGRASHLFETYQSPSASERNPYRAAPLPGRPAPAG